MWTFSYFFTVFLRILPSQELLCEIYHPVCPTALACDALLLLCVFINRRIRGAPGTRHPHWVQMFSFSCTFGLKLAKLISYILTFWVGVPLGNPGSTTVLYAFINVSVWARLLCNRTRWTYPEIDDANFKCAVWIFEQQLALRMRLHCAMSLLFFGRLFAVHFRIGNLDAEQ